MEQRVDSREPELTIRGHEAFIEKYGLVLNEENIQVRLHSESAAKQKDVTIIVDENPFLNLVLTARSIARQKLGVSSGESTIIRESPFSDKAVIYFSPSVAKANYSRSRNPAFQEENIVNDKVIFEHELSKVVELYSALETVGNELRGRAAGDIAIMASGTVIALGGLLTSSEKGSTKAMARLAAVGLGALTALYGALRTTKTVWNISLLGRQAYKRANEHTSKVTKGETEDELVSYPYEEEA